MKSTVNGQIQRKKFDRECMEVFKKWSLKRRILLENTVQTVERDILAGKTSSLILKNNYSVKSCFYTNNNATPKLYVSTSESDDLTHVKVTL